MTNELASRFMRALARAATQRLGPEQAIVAARRAAELTNARTSFDRREPQIADALLAAVHKQLREDGAAILAQWRPGRPPVH